MLPDRFKGLFRGLGGSTESPESSSRSHSGPEIVLTRQSRGLEQFFAYIRDHVGLSILDLGGATQENINFITNLGHKVYTQNILRSLEETFGDDVNEQSNAGRIEYFLQQNLEFTPDSFDGVLLWDVLQYMSPALLNATLDRLLQIVRRKSYLLAFFQSDEKAVLVPRYTFKVQDQSTLVVVQRGAHKQLQSFNNRSLEKLFQRFESVKFFLTRESLREVIIKR